MFSFAAVLLLLRGALSQYDQSVLDDICDVYYSACAADGNCNTYESAATSACSGSGDNIIFGRCFYNHDANYLDNAEFLKLALCLVENTKNVEDFTCFNNGTMAVECDSRIPANMDFKLAPAGSTLISNTRHDTELTIEWGDMNIIVRPIEWDECVVINGSSTCEEAIADLIPHMNLHACKIDENQKACSALFTSGLVDSELDLTTNNLGNPGKHYPYIFFPSAGMWRLLGHIQIYEEQDSGTRIKWDISSGIDINVTLKPPTQAPTIPLASDAERETGGNNVALIVCLILVAICAGGCGYCYWFGGFGDDSYDDEDYEIDEDYDPAEDKFVNTGIDDQKDMPAGGVELTGKGSKLEAAPEMDQLATGGIYAKLMANKKKAAGGTPEKGALPPAPTPPEQAGNVV